MKVSKYILFIATLLLATAAWGQTEYKDLCPGDTITWKGKKITTGGTYTHTSGETTYQLIVTLLPPPADTVWDERSVCENDLDTFRWHGLRFKQSGIYRYKKPNTCDTIFRLNLTVLPKSKDSTITHYFCIVNGYHYPVGQINRKDTTYIEHNKNILGCDSIVTKVFRHKPYYSFPIMHQHPKDSVIHFVFNDSVYTKDGRYYQYYRSQDNCDSVYEITVATRYDIFKTEVKCEGDIITHGGRVIDSTCVVTDSLKTYLGADSLTHYQYSFKKPLIQYDTIVICQGDTFYWENHYDKTTGEIRKMWQEGLYDDLNNFSGLICDSSYYLFLKVSPSYHKDSVVSICNDSLVKYGGKITWTDSKGILHTISGFNIDTTIIDTLSKTAPFPIDTFGRLGGGCDSIFYFRVKIHDRCSELDSIAWCESDREKEVNGIKYTSPGRYYQKPDGDSIYSFEFYRVKNDTTTDEVTICESKLPLIYKDKNIDIRQTGDRVVKFTNKVGCDSLVLLHVNVIPTIRKEYVFSDFCSGQPIRVDISGKVYTKTGNFVDTVQVGACGCDSITIVKIQTKPSISKYDSTYLRPGDTIYWAGSGSKHIPITEPGTYRDSLLNDYGCYDKYTFTVREAKKFEENQGLIHVCTNQPFTWHGQSVDHDGVYHDSLTTMYNMDSVYIVEFKIDPTYSVPITHTLCHGDYIEIKGKNYYETTVVYDTLHTTCGCDSVIIHLVNVNSTFQPYDTTAYCAEGDSILWRGKYRKTEGNYSDTVRTKIFTNNPCDSIIYHLHLKIVKPFLDEKNMKLCQGFEPFDWHGQQISKAGEYEKKYATTQLHLDSIYRLHVDTFPTYFTSYTVQMCKGSSYNFGDEVITEPGVYVHTHSSVISGCDSTVRCIVSYAPQYTNFVDTSYVDDSELPLIWHNKEIYGEGYYYDTLKTYNYECDSIIRLHVIKKKSYFFSHQVKICDSSLPYYWRGKTLTEGGIYQAKYTTVHGRDSIYQIELIVNPTDSAVLRNQLCLGGTYNFFGRILTEPGIYRDTLPNQFGCDSIFILYISRPETQETVLYRTLCDGQSISIGGRPVLESGNYYDTLRTEAGCDSILHYIVSQEGYFWDDKVIVKEGETYMWHRDGQPWPLTKVGVYFDSCKTVIHGCDSIYRLELIRPVKDSTAYINKCDGSSFTVDGVTYTQSTSFTKTIKGSHGGDSLRIKYVLNFFQRYTITQTVTLKMGDSILLGDSVIKTTGIYYRRLQTQYGCDSLITLIVKSCPDQKISTTRMDLCSGEMFILDGDTITSSTTRTRLLKAADGCDSTAVYDINFISTINSTSSAFICPGESYSWRGKTYNKQGVYIEKVPQGEKCFDTYTLQLTYRPSSYRDTVISMCKDKLPYIYKGVKYWVDSIFNDTLPNNIYGCDSILRWHYEINQHCSDYDTYYRCANQPIYVEGMIITEQGVYSVRRISQTGEDSLYRFRVLDVPPYERYTSHTGCDSITLAGTTYYARGAGNETFVVDITHHTVHGCDSIEHATLTIYSSSPKYTEYATIADYEQYLFDKRYFNTEGTHTLVYHNMHGCDSIRELVLTVEPTHYLDTIYYNFCKGDKSGIKVFGHTYFPTKDTIISDTTRMDNQPTIRPALVYVQEPFVISQFNAPIDQMLCAADKVTFEVSYGVIGRGMPNNYRVTFQVGDLDISPKPFAQAVKGKNTLPVEIDGQGLVVPPGYYTYEIQFTSFSCSYSDTTLTGKVMVRYPSDIMQPNWDNMVTLQDVNTNVGHWALQSPYEWQIKDKYGKDKTARVAPSNNSQPYLASNELRKGDSITVTLYRSDYRQPIPSCPCVFTPVQYSQYNTPILVYPTTTRKHNMVHIESAVQGEYQLYNSTGNMIQTGTVMSGENNVIMPGVEGCYLMKIILISGEERLEKLIVY